MLIANTRILDSYIKSIPQGHFVSMDQVSQGLAFKYQRYVTSLAYNRNIFENSL